MLEKCELVDFRLNKKTSLSAIAVLVLCLSTFTGFTTLAQQNPTPTVWIKIYRIQAVDPIEGFLQDGADWRYKIYVWNGEDWSSLEHKPESNHDDIIVNRVHKFDNIETTTTTVYIDLLEDDPFGYEIADISSRKGVSRFYLTYNLKDNTIGGDEVIVEGAYYKTSGDYDGSVAVDENDANLWFDIWDNYNPPTADAGSDQTVYTGEKVNFDGSWSIASTGSYINKYEWDFENDGVVDAEGQKTSYTYPAKGWYYAVLKVTDNLGESDTDVCVINVLNRAPTASFTYSPSSPTVQDEIHLVDTSEDEDGTITSWGWDFGDGGTSTEQNPAHQYADKGNYTVSLTVTDNDDAKNTITKKVTIYNLEPTADFTHSPTSPTVDEDVQFTDESTDPEGKLVSCLWDFGDGYTSTVESPVHKYEKAGTYTVKLTVTDDEGTTDTISKTIEVKEAPFGGGVQLWIIIAFVLVAIAIVAGIGIAVKRRKPAS